MFRRVATFLFLAGIIIVIGDRVIIAQTAPTSGTVELKKADGTTQPLAGALVEVYRTDIKASAPPAKTDKNGQFTFAGLQIGWTFILSVSAPGAAPNVFPGVRAGQERLLLALTPGDGRKFSEAEARSLVASAGKGNAAGAEMSAEDKKAQAEFEAKKKEVEEKNKKAENTNQIVTAALKAGNEAFQAGNFDLAITKYDEGIAADPNYVGSAPIFHNNRGTALTSRAVDTFNKAIKSADVSQKVAGLTSAKKDLLDSANDYVASWNVLKNAPAADIADKANYDSTKLGALRGAKEAFKMAVKTEQVDTGTIEAAKLLMPEYIAAEADPAKKAEARLIFADLYRVAGDSENAIAAYKAILDASPADIDALAGAGLSLVNQGYIDLENGKTNNNKELQDAGKAKLQEGSNLLQKYASSAPDGHKYKADALGLIESLKKEQNVTPQKVTTPARRKPGS